MDILEPDSNDLKKRIELLEIEVRELKDFIAMYQGILGRLHEQEEEKKGRRKEMVNLAAKVVGKKRK